ncbi:serine/threonine protein kinase [Inquilinus limosus]|uniref:serine/threonine-protein kinase n=1 Tax=Inquilinus limosus TaxID=171674 RepID=UPI003F13B059
MITKIKLERSVWSLDESKRLGPPGGFGEVFRGKGGDGEVAIKRLKLTASAAAHREMNIGKVLSNRTLANIVPILDYGQDADTDRYYLVMPICDRSLQEVLEAKGSLDWEQAKTVALDVIAGLMEVNDIVHRDLKPGNVLWYEGRWQVADFGIAKFVEDSTSLETLRGSLTPSYAAPEQWLGEPPTRATDVYALGCILHAMLNGKPPFGGDLETIRRAHLTDQPPELTGVDPRLNGLVQFMLRKNAPSRPSLERCSAVIKSISTTPLRSRNLALAAAGYAVAQEEAAMEARRRAEETAKRERASLIGEAIREFKALMKRLFDEIDASSEAVRREALAISMGPAHLMFREPEPTSAGRLRGLTYDNGWDVAASSSISLRATLGQNPPHDSAVYTFSASVVFARTREDPDFRWRELSFFQWMGRSSIHERPVALDPTSREFQLALSNAMSGWQVAHGPWPIDAEDEESFQDRWLKMFARAARRELHPPTSLPLRPIFFD